MMSCILKWKVKDFPSTVDIWIDKGVTKIKSITLGLQKWRKDVKHAQESKKASHIWKYLKANFLENHLKKKWKTFLSFENCLLRI